MKTTKTISVFLVLTIVGSYFTLLGCAYDSQASLYERALYEYQQSANRPNENITDDQLRQSLHDGPETWDTIFYGLIDQQIDLLVEVYEAIFPFR